MPGVLEAVGGIDEVPNLTVALNEQRAPGGEDWLEALAGRACVIDGRDLASGKCPTVDGDLVENSAKEEAALRLTDHQGGGRVGNGTAVRVGGHHIPIDVERVGVPLPSHRQMIPLVERR